ncbi:hypothetical protein K1T71_009485 [Dendrolimus kikuchii]|uniref:Uncharacterized protein n=1 Tax=Dendrolimus kikuchii TaxID=765133 RepID=A0ACC1CV65_9NEOP|nr:hypothetical protein K1T71_009485 [Dendrolimus kikuchii]
MRDIGCWPKRGEGAPEFPCRADGFTGSIGDPSAVGPAPPSAMDHEDDRSLSLGTEVSASVPPPSPLTGCYLLAVIGEPHTHEHKEIILQRLVKGRESGLRNVPGMYRRLTFFSLCRRQVIRGQLLAYWVTADVLVTSMERKHILLKKRDFVLYKDKTIIEIDKFQG